MRQGQGRQNDTVTVGDSERVTDTTVEDLYADGA